MMDELTRLLDLLAESKVQHETNQQAKLMTMMAYEHRGRMMQAQRNAQMSASVLQSRKDAVCDWLLKNREKLEIQA